MRYFFSILLLLSSIQANAITLTTMQQEKRVAFIIGNGDYEEAPMENAVDDATQIKNFLEKHNFKVIYKEDASKREIIQGLRTFNSEMSEGGIALFYFTGHAVQVREKNYLIPVEAAIDSDHHVLYEAIELDAILGKMNKAGNRLNIVMLDASRQSPFGDRFRAKKQGLAPIDRQSDMDLILSASPNKIANPQSFTTKLLSILSTKGVSNEEGLKEFKKRYKESYIQLSKEAFYFNLPNSLQTKEDKTWSQTLALNSVVAYNAYLGKFPNAKYSSEAKKKINVIESSQKLEKQKLLEEEASKDNDIENEALVKQKQINEQKQAEKEAALLAENSLKEQQKQDIQDVSYVDPMMVLIKAGDVVTSFTETEEGKVPNRKINIEKDFYIGYYEVSNVEFNEFLKAHGRTITTSKWSTEFQPAVNLSWKDANDYAQWLSRLTGQNYRLPTQDEWEYAARASSELKYYWGDRDTSHRKDAWRKDYPDNAHNFSWMQTNAQDITHTVGSKKPNPWGIYDILGNASEWCVSDDKLKPVRGGSWSSTAEELAISHVSMHESNFKDNTIGFRLVLDQ